MFYTLGTLPTVLIFQRNDFVIARSLNDHEEFEFVSWIQISDSTCVFIHNPMGAIPISCLSIFDLTLLFYVASLA